MFGSPPQAFRTRQQMFKSITPDYYGFRDEEDGVLLAVEAEAEAALQAKVSTRLLPGTDTALATRIWAFDSNVCQASTPAIPFTAGCAVAMLAPGMGFLFSSACTGSPQVTLATPS